MDHNIRTWRKHSGRWEVTHHRGGKRERALYDVSKDFKIFKDRKSADGEEESKRYK